MLDREFRQFNYDRSNNNTNCLEKLAFLNSATGIPRGHSHGIVFAQKGTGARRNNCGEGLTNLENPVYLLMVRGFLHPPDATGEFTVGLK